jgi:multisubunit Na+/H+ antiporter MnhF subunit
VNQWLWASTLLIGFEVPLLVFGAFAARLDALVALQAAGGIAAMALITLAEGFHRTSYTILAVVASVLTFAGSMVFVRFFERELDP